MASLNKVQLIGYIGQNAELKYTSAGAAIVTFSVATSDTWTDKVTKEKKEHTEWHRIVFWGKYAESVAAYLVKGKQVYVEGNLKTRKWQDKDTGIDRYTTEIRCERVKLLGRREGTSNAQAQAADDSDAPVDQVDDSDIPF